MRKEKKATTYDEQIALLRKHGAVIVDEAFCRRKLSALNYYRFTAYFLPFRQKDGNYLPETSFHRVYRIYEFDRKLRSLLFSTIEEVEIFLRSKLAYFHGHKYGPYGYMNPEHYSSSHEADKFHETIERAIKNNDKVLFVKHHIEHYDGKFPIWVIVELFTLGMLSRFYADMTTADKKALAKDIYATTAKNISSWLRCITDLRNICAHYGRLYYRILPAIPAGFDIPDAAKRRLWGALLALRGLYPDRDKWNYAFMPGIEALFDTYHGDIDLYHIAFPEDWCVKLRK